MKKQLLLVLIILIGISIAEAQNPWTQLYSNSNLNSFGYTTYSYIEFDSNGDLYLAERVNPDFVDLQVKVSKYDGTNWNQIGPMVNLNVLSNEIHFDFVIAPNNKMYIGMLDSILYYDDVAQQWFSTYVPEYIGGLCSDDNSNIYFLHYQPQAGNPLNNEYKLASFDNGTVNVLATIDVLNLVTPRRVNRSNRIITKNGEFYVSLARASTTILYFFKGNPVDGFTRLQSSVNPPSTWGHLSISSMAVDPNGLIALATPRNSGSTSWMELYQYNPVSDDWDPIDTTGIHSISANITQLRYDNNNVLHLIYNGSNNTGFVYSYDGTSWQHIGPRNIVGLSSVNAPYMSFSSTNVLHFVHGFGSPGLPLRVYRYEDAPTSIANDISGNKVIVFPNPSEGQFTIQVNETKTIHQNYTYRLLDITGKEVKRAALQQLNTTVNAEDMARGFYTLQILSDSAIISTTKLVFH
jgi:hypothetical protein